MGDGDFGMLSGAGFVRPFLCLSVECFTYSKGTGKNSSL